MDRETKNIKPGKIANSKMANPDHFVPDDDKIPLIVNDPDDLPEDDPFENPAEEPPVDGEGP